MMAMRLVGKRRTIVGDSLDSPAGGSASDQVKNLVGLRRGKASLLALMVEP